MLLEIIFVVFLMYCWFDTDFFIEYSRFFGLSNKFKISDWEKWREKYPKVGYLDYISTRHRNFTTKLISCRQCVCFWMALLVSHFGIGIIYLPIIYLSSLFIYNLYVFIIWKLKKS